MMNMKMIILDLKILLLLTTISEKNTIEILK